MEVGGNLKVIVRVRSTLPKDDDCIVDINEPEGQVGNQGKLFMHEQTIQLKRCLKCSFR